MNRREFIFCSAAGAAGLATGATSAGNGAAKLSPKFGYTRLVKTEAPPRNRRPYANVDWAKAIRINTTSHGHCEDQLMLDKMQEKTEELLSIVSGGEKDSDKLFAAITEAIDGILGEDSARRILSEKLCPDMFDALEVYTFICIEFAGAWKERILRTTEPVA